MMSIRSLIRAALSAVAKIVVVATEVVINGVRTIVRTLVPARNTAALDAAEEVLFEDRPEVSASNGEDARDVRERGRPSEPERVRRAATHLLRGRPIPAAYLDPSASDDREILSWMATLDALQLGMLAKAGDSDIVLHLAGTKKLRMPLLPRDEAPVQAKRDRAAPLSYDQWVRVLMARAAENGDDDPDLDTLLDEAEALANRNATMADWKRAMPRVSEDAGAEG